MNPKTTALLLWWNIGTSPIPQGFHRMAQCTTDRAIHYCKVRSAPTNKSSSSSSSSFSVMGLQKLKRSAGIVCAWVDVNNLLLPVRPHRFVPLHVLSRIYIYSLRGFPLVIYSVNYTHRRTHILHTQSSHQHTYII